MVTFSHKSVSVLGVRRVSSQSVIDTTRRRHVDEDLLVSSHYLQHSSSNAARHRAESNVRKQVAAAPLSNTSFFRRASWMPVATDPCQMASFVHRSSSPLVDKEAQEQMALRAVCHRRYRTGPGPW
ncbi:unnamed protein product [Soboliphyme baturini]|uniref:Uncharacterized protein n=1 Tax=Soboliphyme baturini TaxID=241478 RepID=A0A183IEQ3_9BILA|nr:unnamed protein product [Soboliphyme baturini]